MVKKIHNKCTSGEIKIILNLKAKTLAGLWICVSNIIGKELLQIPISTKNLNSTCKDKKCAVDVNDYLIL